MFKPFQNQKGLALLLVLLVITLLIAMVVEFDYWTRIDLRSAGNLRDGLQAVYLARGGVASAQAILKDDYRRNSNTTDLTGTWAIPLPPIPLGEGTVLLKITDEASKFNLNNLAVGGQTQNAVSKTVALFGLVQVPTELAKPIVAAIADWVGAGNNGKQPSNCAEESYYQSLPKPYHCKNKPMDSLSELHLIKGMTDEIYNKISPYLTVAAASSAITLAPINVNTADPIVLGAVLNFDETQAKKFIESRPFRSKSDVLKLYQAGTPESYSISLNSPFITVSSNTFSVESHGKVHDVEKTIRSILVRQAGIVTIKTWRVE